MYQPKYETETDITDAIEHLLAARGLMEYVAVFSDLIYQAQMDQFIDSVSVTMHELIKIKESLEEDKND